MGIRTDGFFSLFSRFNKKRGRDDEIKEGLIESLGVLELDMGDEEILSLTKQWDLLYSGSELKAKIVTEGDLCKKYWMGRQYPDTEYENGKRPLTDNVIFPNLEQLLATATQQNPEPIVVTDNGEAFPAIAPSVVNPTGSPAVPMSAIGDKIRMSLEYLARTIKLKNVLRKGSRHWAMRFVGVFHTVWDGEQDELTVKTYNPKDLILDPNGYVDERGEYHGDFVGIKLKDTARNLITRFPEKEEDITRECEGKLGSLMGYIQWRTNEYVAYTMKDTVLFKHKNEFWNYGTDIPVIDELGQTTVERKEGENHWKYPKIPMRFLVVYDLGDGPADNTTLVSQALVTQDNINKGLKQYDRNVDQINGGVVVNGLMFNKEQAAQVAEARRQGRTVVTPGRPEEAIYYPPNNPVPDSLMQRINDDRIQVAMRMGTYGSTPLGTQKEKTVRGKVMAADEDETRTGGGLSASLEIVAEGIFDDLLQGIYVFWDTPHKVSVLGPDNAETFIEFQASDIPPGRQITTMVQDGSMVPQDEVSNYNQAMAEVEAGISDPLSYFEKTKDPNPLERAQRFMVYKSNPAMYMQEYLQIAPPAPAVQVEGGGEGGGGTGPPVPDAVASQESNLLNEVPV